MDPRTRRGVTAGAAAVVVTVVLLASVAGAGAGAGIGVGGAATQPSDPYVYVEDQAVDGTARVVVGNATLPEGGFLVLRQGDNRAGEFVGATDYLEPGYFGRVEVPFEDRYYYTEDTQHVVIAIEDTDGDRELDGDDQVYEAGSGRAQDTFVIETIITPTPPEETPTRSPTPDDGGAGDDTPTAAEGTTAPAGVGGDDDVENQLTADGGSGGPPLWLLGAGVLAVVGVGAALRLRGGSEGTGGGDGTAGAADDGTGGATAGAVGGAAEQTADPRAVADRRRIERLLTENSGRMKQADIVDETGWSESKVSQLLSEMEDEDRVSVLRVGRERIISTEGTEPEIAGSPPDGDADTAGEGDRDAPEGSAATDAGDGTPNEADSRVTGAAGAATDEGVDGGASSGNWRAMVPGSVPGGPDIDIAYDDLDVGEFVGGGGSADVHRATADGPVTVALKRPRARGTLHAEQVERFVEEAETWARLDDHDGIVDVVGWGSSPLPWLAMEYMDGGDLAARAGEVGLAEGLWTAVSLCEAVNHAHRRGIAHLDLKPANVLYRESEGWDAPKVTDWGLSKHLIEHSASVEGMTPQYAAPEQFDDDYGAADDITDVYGLGAVCYELLTGRPPYEGRPTEVMNAVMHETPPAPSEVADLPLALDDVLLTALATEKADRYETVLYLRDDLQAVLEDL